MQNLPLHVYTAFEQAEEPELLLRGFQKYLKSTYEFTYVKRDKIFCCKQSSLFYYKAIGKNKGSIFIVPSLINGAEIFDLTENYSFIRYMVTSGFDIYLVNWGNLIKGFEGDLDTLFSEKMLPLWQAANNYSETKLHVLGYCLGGTLCSTFFSKYKEIRQPQSITFLATPFDFHTAQVPWEYVVSKSANIISQIKFQNALTQRMLQSHFIKLKPEFIIQKYKQFLKMSENSPEEKRFVAVERWLNNGPDLPQVLSLDIMDYYFLQNRSVPDMKILPPVPKAVIYSDKDLIVPPQALQIFIENYPDSSVIKNYAGHVGMMVGHNAQSSVWEPYKEFLYNLAVQ